MGKPKRKRTTAQEDVEQEEEANVNVVDDPPKQPVPKKLKNSTNDNENGDSPKKQPQEGEETAAAASSHYAMKSHSGEIVHEDMYVSSSGGEDNQKDDDSEDDDEANNGGVELILTSARMGLMRSSTAHASNAAQLVQPHRQWKRNDKQEGNDGQENDNDAEEEDAEAALESITDPVLREQRLQQLQREKEEREKQLARQQESEENAGRDPTLFSKRTAFDIRFDQIEDKPWERPGADPTEFFNYSFSEQEWLHYAQQQLEVRQELIDAAKMKRPPNPDIVPVQPKIPMHQQASRVAVATLQNMKKEGTATVESGATAGPSVGPTTAMSIEPEDSTNAPAMEGTAEWVSEGGAWGAGASPLLAKLIQEQENAYPPPIHRPFPQQQEPQQIEQGFGGSPLQLQERGGRFAGGRGGGRSYMDGGRGGGGRSYMEGGRGQGRKRSFR